MNEVEKWRELPILNGRYKISSFGRVYSCRGRKGSKYTELKPYDNSTGYKQVNLMGDDGKEHKRYVHRLVASVFLPNPNNLTEVNHKNGDKADNTASNLEWVSHKDNIRHSIKVLGHKPMGAKPKKVKDITTGRIFNSVKEASNEYAVKPCSIYNQINGRVKTVPWPYLLFHLKYGTKKRVQFLSLLPLFTSYLARFRAYSSTQKYA